MEIGQRHRNREPQGIEKKTEDPARKQIVVTALGKQRNKETPLRRKNILLIPRHFRVSIFIQPT